jgi:hypothetical protein
MPSGYTADIYEGKEVTFADFALSTARGLGYAIMQRDDSPGPVEPRKASQYIIDAVPKAQDKWASLIALSPDDWQQRLINARADLRAEIAKSRDVRHALRGRYEAMLDQVNDWNPPTPEHESLKKLMGEQLLQSIDFDTSEHQWLPPEMKEDWREYRDRSLNSASKEVTRAKEELRKELDRVAEQNAWVTALRDSLGVKS